ncbi:MAG: HlyD family efflux transporter periplasmic adaptor subunit [bacterium]|nr:HlyD family efflux transporter periplasmic adaptor subunit [bacterium]
MRAHAERSARRRREGPPELRAVMPGKVLAVLVAAGDAVVLGQGIVVIEAMKMENELGAPRSGVVHELEVQVGQAVESGELLAVIA